MDLRWRQKAHDDTVTLEIEGEIDLHSAPQLRGELHRLSETGVKNLIVDLGEVTFIDSTGIGVLVGALRRARESGGGVAFCCARQRVRRVFEITGLLYALPLHGTRADAIKALGVSAAEPQEESDGG